MVVKLLRVLVGIVVNAAAVRYEKIGEIRAAPTPVAYAPGSPNTVRDLEI
jgi:hypothetical protein